jgi:3-oxoadipate CoA-transferase beta subunit
VLDITRDGIVVREIVEGLDLDALQKLTEPKLVLAKDWKRIGAPTFS